MGEIMGLIYFNTISDLKVRKKIVLINYFILGKNYKIVFNSETKEKTNFIYNDNDLELINYLNTIKIQNNIKSPKIGISACLSGKNTKYDGKNNEKYVLKVLSGICHWILICPELAGLLGVPRIPCERVGNQVYNKIGQDKTKAFELGVKKALNKISINNVEMLILKEGSPSCGVNRIYDGTFKGNKINGKGLFTESLENKHIKIITEELFN